MVYLEGWPGLNIALTRTDLPKNSREQMVSINNRYMDRNKIKQGAQNRPTKQAEARKKEQGFSNLGSAVITQLAMETTD